MALHLTRRGRVVRLVGLIGAGVSFGILVSAVNHGFGPASGYVSKVIGNAGMWLAMGLAACLLGRGWRSSSLCGVGFLWPAVVGYYIADIASGVYTSTPFVDTSGLAQLDLLGAVADIVGYGVISALASAVLAVVVLVIRRGGLVGLLGTVAVPGYVAYDALMSHRKGKALPAAFHDTEALTVSWYLGLTALAVTALLIVVRMAQSCSSADMLHQAWALTSLYPRGHAASRPWCGTHPAADRRAGHTQQLTAVRDARNSRPSAVNRNQTLTFSGCTILRQG